MTVIAWNILPSYGWRMLAYLNSIPVGLGLIGALFFLPESPRWLVSEGRTEEAVNIIHYIAKTNNVLLAKFKFKQPTQQKLKRIKLSILFSPEWLRICIALWIVWFSFGLCYYSLVLLLSKLYSNDENQSCSFQYSKLFLISLLESLGFTMSFLIASNWGRITSQVVFYILGSISTIILGIAINFSDNLVLVSGIVSRLSFVAASSIVWLATPELFPTELRASGHSVANSFARVGAICSPFLVSINWNTAYTSFVIAIVSCSALIAVLYLPETKDQDLDDVGQDKSDEKTPLLGHSQHRDLNSYMTHSNDYREIL